MGTLTFENRCNRNAVNHKQSDMLITPVSVKKSLIKAGIAHLGAKSSCWKLQLKSARLVLLRGSHDGKVRGK